MLCSVSYGIVYSVATLILFSSRLNSTFYYRSNFDSNFYVIELLFLFSFVHYIALYFHLWIIFGFLARLLSSEYDFLAIGSGSGAVLRKYILFYVCLGKHLNVMSFAIKMLISSMRDVTFDLLSVDYLVQWKPLLSSSVITQLL